MILHNRPSLACFLNCHATLSLSLCANLPCGKLLQSECGRLLLDGTNRHFTAKFNAKLPTSCLRDSYPETAACIEPVRRRLHVECGSKIFQFFVAPISCNQSLRVFPYRLASICESRCSLRVDCSDYPVNIVLLKITPRTALELL